MHRSRLDSTPLGSAGHRPLSFRPLSFRPLTRRLGLSSGTSNACIFCTDLPLASSALHSAALPEKPRLVRGWNCSVVRHQFKPGTDCRFHCTTLHSSPVSQSLPGLWLEEELEPRTPGASGSLSLLLTGCSWGAPRPLRHPGPRCQAARLEPRAEAKRV